jgi:hypothetical protein
LEGAFSGVQAVDVIVASCVIEELYQHKASTNQRRHDRTLLALGLVESASREPDLALVLKDLSVCLLMSSRQQPAAGPTGKARGA